MRSWKVGNMQEDKTKWPFFSCDVMNKKVQNSNYSEKLTAPSDPQGLSFLFCPPQSAHLNSLCLMGGRKEGKYFFLQEGSSFSAWTQGAHEGLPWDLPLTIIENPLAISALPRHWHELSMYHFLKNKYLKILH